MHQQQTPDKYCKLQAYNGEPLPDVNVIQVLDTGTMVPTRRVRKHTVLFATPKELNDYSRFVKHSSAVPWCVLA